eukprot:3221929-Pleurochrysis_carterae.AAC.1
MALLHMLEKWAHTRSGRRARSSIAIGWARPSPMREVPGVLGKTYPIVWRLEGTEARESSFELAARAAAKTEEVRLGDALA